MTALVLVLSMPAPVAAQSAGELLAEGIRAYRELEMEAASRFLRRALQVEGLPVPDRARALAYLGASELFRDRRDSSEAAFTRLVLLDPRFRIDQVVFPPEVSATFDEVRNSTPVTAVDVPGRVTFEPGRGGLAARIYPSTPHTVVVWIERADGRRVRVLHEGRVADSVRVVWDGDGVRGARLDDGLYLLSVLSHDRDGRPARSVEVPVRLERTTRNAVALPPQPVMLPERAPAGPAFARLALGVGAAVTAALVMPALTSSSSDETAARVSAATVFSLAGVIGFVERRPGKPYPDNVVANRAARAAWEARVAAIEAENRDRRPGERIVIETGRPTVRRVTGP